jgi:hypothetical protein
MIYIIYILYIIYIGMYVHIYIILKKTTKHWLQMEEEEGGLECNT